jgi:NitT/TauT family transport system permease protein
MALASQWYVLFNVVAGALAIPADLLEAAAIFQLRGFSRWRLLLVPGIFAHLVTGLITAAGAAWNATVVAEYISFGGEVYRTAGIGAFITARAEAGDTPGLLAGTLVMAGLVVAIDRVFWRRLYGWAESRFRVE